MSSNDNNGNPVPRALVLIVTLYLIFTGIFVVPYYNWRYARDNGFVSWLLMGEVVATAKALVWPYFALFNTSTSSEAHLSRKWSAEEVANSKHFLFSIQADLQSKKLSNERADPTLSASESREILGLKETALREIRLVDKATLRKINPDLPRHVETEYIPAIESMIQHLRTHGGDPEAMQKGTALFDTWAEWWNANRDAIYIPN